MKFYQEISLLPNADINTYFLWRKVYQQIHLALVENKISDNTSAIGVSFPKYNKSEHLLGTKLRLFGKDTQILYQMDCKRWLRRLNDYVQLSQIRQVPKNIDEHACFKHIKLKGSKRKLAKRWAKRHNETIQQAMAHFNNYEEPHTRLPYINMVSETNKHHYKLFIEKKIMTEAQAGKYSCYGLSKITTVPLF